MFINYINYFTSLLLIVSNIKIYGYAYSFIIFLPWSVLKYKNLFNRIRKLKLINKLVSYYFYFLLIQSLMGAIYLKDIRVVLFWIPFFFICLFSYYSNIYNLNTNKFYYENIEEIIFRSSLVYFLLYFIFNFFSLIYFGNAYQIQDSLWVGSSSAFSLSSYLLFSLYNIWKDNNYKLNSIYSFGFIFIIFMSQLNDSRLGKLYVLIFSIFILFENISRKNFLKFLSLILILTLSYSSSSYITSNVLNYFNKNHIKTKDQNIPPLVSKSITKDIKESFTNIYSTKEIFKEGAKLSGDHARILDLLVAKEKFQTSSLKEKLIGTGWYTSRVTINTIRDKYVEKYSDVLLCNKCFTKSKITQLQGITAITVDTGLIGLGFTLLLYFLCIKNFLKSKLSYLHKGFYFSLLLINFFCLFIGYPMVNILYILFYLPGGILNLKKNNLREII